MAKIETVKPTNNKIICKNYKKTNLKTHLKHYLSAAASIKVLLYTYKIYYLREYIELKTKNGPFKKHTICIFYNNHFLILKLFFKNRYAKNDIFY